MSSQSYLETSHGSRLAYHYSAGKSPGIVFLNGFMSNMNGTKALHLEKLCQKQGIAYVRFDYTGHGQSSGSIFHGTIGIWLKDSLAILDSLFPNAAPVLVGSSMGGWLALLIGRQHRPLSGIVGIAAAPDFTERQLWPKLNEAQRHMLVEKGSTTIASTYTQEPYIVTNTLIQDARQYFLLNDNIDVTVPIHLIHGQHDEDIPWQTSLEVASRIQSNDVTIHLVKNGNHRLSKPSDLLLLDAIISHLI